jgi:hypothetical protein
MFHSDSRDKKNTRDFSKVGETRIIPSFPAHLEIPTPLSVHVYIFSFYLGVNRALH